MPTLVDSTEVNSLYIVENAPVFIEIRRLPQGHQAGQHRYNHISIVALPKGMT